MSQEQDIDVKKSKVRIKKPPFILQGTKGGLKEEGLPVLASINLLPVIQRNFLVEVMSH